MPESGLSQLGVFLCLRVLGEATVSGPVLEGRVQLEERGRGIGC